MSGRNTATSPGYHLWDSEGRARQGCKPVLGLGFDEANAITKLIPAELKMTIDKALARNRTSNTFTTRMSDPAGDRHQQAA